MDVRTQKIVSRLHLKEMAKLIVAQQNRLHELEVKLQKEVQAKANLMVDFQHLLDQLPVLSMQPNLA